MLIFMDKLALRKIKLLELLSLENREFNIIEISSYLGCTDRTVLKTIQCLKVDFESWKDNIEIINRDNKFIYLKKSIYFSLELIQLNYLKNSLTFNACNDIFHQRYVDTNTFASKNYVSYPTMNRRIKQLKPLLNKFKLLYLSKPRATFVGSEKQFRYFFIYFIGILIGEWNGPFQW